MITRKYNTENGAYNLTIQNNLEYVNPIAADMNTHFTIERNLVYSVGNALDPDPRWNNVKEKIATENFHAGWKSHLEEINSVVFPKNFFEFLTCKKKNKQENILQTLHFTASSLTALFYKAFEQFDFLYSFYRFEKIPRILNKKVRRILPIGSRTALY